MIKKKQLSNKQETLLYNNIVLLSRNKLFYTKFDLSDTFQNRINLIFMHISFLFIKIKLNRNNDLFKTFYQKIFDLLFINIEHNMREIGYGDVSINKKMKMLVKTFYDILLNCEKYRAGTNKTKYMFFTKYLDLNMSKRAIIDDALIDYFDKYDAFCVDLSVDNVLKGEINFNYK